MPSTDSVPKKYQPVFERILTCRSLLNLTTYLFTSGVEFDQGYLSFLFIGTRNIIFGQSKSGKNNPDIANFEPKKASSNLEYPLTTNYQLIFVLHYYKILLWFLGSFDFLRYGVPLPPLISAKLSADFLHKCDICQVEINRKRNNLFILLVFLLHSCTQYVFGA